jgi:glucose/arabinose dehydrogenase
MMIFPGVETSMRVGVCALSIVATVLLGSVSPAVAQLRATLVVSGLTRPLGFVQDPTDSTVQLVLEQAGRVRVIKGGVLQSTDFVDLRSVIASGGERGLLGLAFAPDYATSGRLFVCFTDRNGHIVVARLKRSGADPLRADPNTRFDLVWPDGRRFVEHPFSNHNGGNLAFGPDRFLYVGMGDGGSGNDPQNYAQNPHSLLGKMLRLDVSVSDDDSRGYSVPPGNPYHGRSDVLSEIWSFGLRNPWRWTFDNLARRGTGAMLIADVGQNRWEEINYEPSAAGGRNYGWRIREGAHDNVTSLPAFSQPLREPIWEYSHSDGRSVTGGFVYRGRALGSQYVGRYFFADFVSSRVWSLRLTIDPVTKEAAADDPVEHTSDLGTGAQSPSSFGVDANDELYLVNYNGAVYRIDPPPGQVPAPDPTVPPPGSPSDPNQGSGPRQGVGDPIGHARPRIR